MLLRLLVYLAGAFAVSRVLRLLAAPPPSPNGTPPSELVHDPVCGVFVPRRKALHAVREGREYFFCSPACESRFGG